MSARLAPRSCVEIPDAGVHVRPCAAPPAVSALGQGRSLSAPPHCSVATSSLLHVCAQVLLSSQGSAPAAVTAPQPSPLQTVPLAELDGGLTVTSLMVRGAGASCCAPRFSLCQPFAQRLHSIN